MELSKGEYDGSCYLQSLINWVISWVLVGYINNSVGNIRSPGGSLAVQWAQSARVMEDLLICLGR